MNSLINWVCIQALKNRIQHVEGFMKQPEDAQERVFHYLIEQGKHTEWGKEYGYKDIRNPEQYRNRVPIHTYEEIFPKIERIMLGEQNVMWPTPIRCFAKSSGTTNAKSKFIPVSKESLEDCHYTCGKDMLSVYFKNNPESSLFAGKGLAVGGSHQANPHNPSTYYGDVSALIMKNLPIWAEFRRTPSLKIALMDEWEAKIEKMAHVTSQEEVTSIQGVPTWTIFLIRRILEITGKDSITEVWPHLECFFHGAVSFDPYREIFKEMIPSSNMNYMEVYNASEGFFGFQDTPGRHEMLLMLDYGIYYEFIPSEEWGKDYPKTVGLDEVEIGKNYAMIISTNGGLWRYNIGDTVTFTSLRPYRIRISGRTKHFINAFGEELVIENAETAITHACLKTNAVLHNFTAAPVYIESGSRGGHEWIIEFEQEPGNIHEFNCFLDDKLRDVNSDYDAKRHKNIALVAPEIHVVPRGTFYRWMKKRGKLGGQHKVPRLSNNRDFLEDILSMLTTESK